MQSTTTPDVGQLDPYPPETPTRCVTPGVLSLDYVVWYADGPRVSGRVGDVAFSIDVATADLLDRKRFAFSLWRFCHLLPVLPSIEDWQGAIEAAERRAA